MKRFTQTFLAAFAAMVLTGNLAAQEQKQNFVTVTTLHWNLQKQNFDQKEWIAIEKEFLDKVIRKNEFILEQKVLMHHFTADNSELLLITTYPSWEAIEKAGKKTDELSMTAWPDEKTRNAYFEKREAYFSGNHSDEIYKTTPGVKTAPKSDKAMVYYVRKSHWAFPKDGNEKEFGELATKYLQATTYKNELAKSYYSLVHAWGSDNTELVETFAIDNLGDLEKMNEKNRELLRTAMPDEAKRKEFTTAYGKYFTRVHADYIYKSIPELTK